MASITSAVTAKTLGDASNIREDLGNVIYNVSPFQTPFTSGIATSAVTADNHEWLTDTLAAAATNEHVEADTSITAVTSTRTRKTNNVQISQKSVIVTQKAEFFDRAGIPGKEMAYQLVKVGKELQMDIELSVLSNYTAKRAATASQAGRSASVASWIGTDSNQSVGSGGSVNGASTGATGPSNGTDRDLTDGIMEGVLDGIWENSGDFSNTKIMADASRVASIRDKLTGIANDVNSDAKTGEIYNRVAVYVSQYGPLAIIPNKHMPANTIYILNMDTWGFGVAGGKKIHTTDIATQTSAEQKLLQTYYSLEARSEEANGAIYDIN
tara:strand:+ start:8550 stop:9527 length:978 start_codon:yes stop_codon:yes gene_type:complete